MRKESSSGEGSQEETAKERRVEYSENRAGINNDDDDDYRGNTIVTSFADNFRCVFC